MADPLSVISSVVGVGIAALQSAKLLFELADGIKNAPEEIKAISNDTHAFYDVVFSLETSLKDADVLSVVQENTAMVAMVANLEKPLRNCSTTLGQLMLKIRDRVKPSVDGKSYKFSSSAQWYFTKKDIKEVLDRLEQNKATLNAALNTITAYIQETSILGSIAPSSPASDSQALSLPIEEDSDSDTELNEIRKPSDAIIEMYEVLLQRTAEQVSPLQKAVKEGDSVAVQTLLSQGADVNAKDVINGMAALHFAAQGGNEAVVRMLVEHGADVNIKSLNLRTFPNDHRGGTALHSAAEYGNEDIIQVLLLIESGADVSARSTPGRTPLHEASRNGQVNAAKLLIENGALIDAQDENGWSLLHEASRLYDKERAPGKLEIAKLLLDHGANIESTANRSGITPLLTAVHSNFIAMVQLLMDKGANFKFQNGLGLTALHIAASSDHVIVRMLLDAGADTEVKDHEDETPLHKAARWGSLKVIRLLLERGADVRAINKDGQDALQVTQKFFANKEAVKILTEY